MASLQAPSIKLSSLLMAETLRDIMHEQSMEM